MGVNSGGDNSWGTIVDGGTKGDWGALVNWGAVVNAMGGGGYCGWWDNSGWGTMIWGENSEEQ